MMSIKMYLSRSWGKEGLIVPSKEKNKDNPEPSK
jgi:hypothetical protein